MLGSALAGRGHLSYGATMFFGRMTFSILLEFVRSSFRKLLDDVGFGPCGPGPSELRGHDAFSRNDIFNFT